MRSPVRDGGSVGIGFIAGGPVQFSALPAVREVGVEVEEVEDAADGMVDQSSTRSDAIAKGDRRPG
jgi:hypothetical protein